MTPWLQSWEWPQLAAVLAIWVIALGLVSWLLGGVAFGTVRTADIAMIVMGVDH